MFFFQSKIRIFFSLAVFLKLTFVMQKKEAGYDVEKLVDIYMKSNYRIVGDLKHSALKPCHWQRQKLLTGRENRNCYKGYFGIPSECCIQNTPSLPFCNHQCVFCWRDIENATFGSEWKGDADSPQQIVKEMLRHSENLIFKHITKKRSLDNLDLMHEILYHYLEKVLAIQNQEKTPLIEFDEMTLAKLMQTSRTKVHQAVLLLKNCEILHNPRDDFYQLRSSYFTSLKTREDVDALIRKEVTTREEIEQVFENAKHPKHAAISLAGEPTLYPYIGELVNEFRKRDMCTFIVTNGTHPDVLRKLWKEGNLPTQLYVTLPAATRLDFSKISRPLTKHAWENLMETLSMLPELPCRTVVRITSVKYLNINLDMVPDYAKILQQYTPNFIDIKGVTIEAHALEMEKRLGKFADGHHLREFAPTHQDLMEFAKELEKVGGFEIIESHEKSRDILLRGNWPKDTSIKIDFNNV